jgi:hypothetical protein
MNTMTAPFAYVARKGNDRKGVVSAASATAKARPFHTIKAAINALSKGGAHETCDAATVRVGCGKFTSQ